MVRKASFLFSILFIIGPGLGTTRCTADSRAQLDEAKANICSFIEGGDEAEAETALQELIDNFPDSDDKGQAIHQIGECYQQAGQYHKAIEVSQYVIDHYAGAQYLVWSQMRIVISNLRLGNEVAAQSAIDDLVTDFGDDPNLPWTLYIIGEECRWARDYEQAKTFYCLIVEQHPDSTYASKAKLGTARANVLGLVDSGSYFLGQQATDKLSADFAKHPDLPATLYDIAQRYSWARKYEEAKGIYQQIVQQHPDSPYAGEAQSCMDKMGQVINILFTLIESGNYSEAKNTIEDLIAQHGDGPDVPAVLYHVASRYEEVGAYPEARYVYDQIIWRYPGDSIADNAQLDKRRTKVLSYFELGNSTDAQAELEMLIADFDGHSHLPTAVILTAEGCYSKALRLEPQADSSEIRQWIRRTLAILGAVIDDLGPSTEVPNALILMGDCYGRLNEYSQAITCYQRVADEYPDYDRAWHALFMVGSSYQDMLKAELVSESEAHVKITAAYQQLIARYPTCKAARIAKLWLSDHQSE